MKFSVLISIYYKEKPEHFNRALQSIWDEQTIKPDEIVLVEDGPLNNELYDVINNYKKKLGEKLKIIPLKTNQGLCNALNEGLKHCNYELVARMDSDDIALPDRFKKQLNVFEKHPEIDVCGSWVSEFENDEKNIYAYRKVPENHEDIKKLAKIRNPLNHPTVMFKKSSVKKVGSYNRKIFFFEDYYLWIQMIQNGAIIYNIQEVLLNMRAGNEQIKRRSGFKYAKYELKFLFELYKIDFFNIIELIFNIFIRIPCRILPKSIIKNIYKAIRAKY